MKAKILFLINGRSFKTSPEFDLSEKEFDSFFDRIGGEDEDSELFWSSDITSSDETIVVDWFDMPSDPQSSIDCMSACFGVTVPEYSLWK